MTRSLSDGILRVHRDERDRDRVVLQLERRRQHDGYRVVAHLKQRLVEDRVPEHLHKGLIAYLTARRPMGGFLTAVVQNDLASAMFQADEESLAGLRNVLRFLTNRVPAHAYGSRAAVVAWLSASDPVPELFE
jgi:hypothetical protein